MPDDENFLRQLRATFEVEAGEHLQTLSRGFFELESSPAGPQAAAIVETVFRAAHSLKGAARAVDLRDIEAICQALEDVLAFFKREGGRVAPGRADVLHKAVAVMESLLSPAADAPPPDLGALRKQLRQLATVGLGTTARARQDFPARLASPVATPVVAPAVAPVEATDGTFVETPFPKAPSAETVRVAVSRLELQLLDTEELLTAKLAASERVAELDELEAWFKTWRKTWAAADASRLEAFCAWNGEAVRALESRVADVRKAVQRDHAQVSKSVDTLLEGAKKLLLLPFSTLSVPLQKLVRDLSRELGKEVDLVVSGGHVELDKRILEEIKDPLIHMLRNAVDHGVEAPHEREAGGKPARAVVTLVVSQLDANRVQIMLADDGRGIVSRHVVEAALRRGALSPDQAAVLTEEEALALIFRTDVSTGAEVTRLSGRGLGLAIVQENARRLGGDVRVQSVPGKGSTFSIQLPAIRATFRGILCEVAGQLLLLPVTDVERVARVRREDIRSVEGRETILVGTRSVALVRLADVLGLAARPAASLAAVDMQVVLAGAGDDAVAFAVDAVVDEQEVLVKPLRKPLVRVRNVAAAAVLGSGKVVPILHVGDLLRSARHVPPATASAGGAGMALPVRRHVLVAEDSITSRMLLKTVLESAGYTVKTAVDGLEAFAMLRSEPFDLLVSDVEMPRLGGFDLTARVRADKLLGELPVVLVTALSSREDRERGIDVGANAYIVKGSFDQDTLVEAVRRLI